MQFKKSKLKSYNLNNRMNRNINKIIKNNFLKNSKFQINNSQFQIKNYSNTNYQKTENIFFPVTQNKNYNLSL